MKVFFLWPMKGYIFFLTTNCRDQKNQLNALRKWLAIQTRGYCMLTASCFLELIQRSLGVWGQDSTCQKESVEKAISEEGCGGKVHTLEIVTTYSLPTVHSSNHSRWDSCWWDSGQQGDLECVRASGHNIFSSKVQGSHLVRAGARMWHKKELQKVSRKP